MRSEWLYMKVCFVVNKLSFFLSHRLDLGKEIASIHDFTLITDLGGVTNQEKKMLASNNIQVIHLKKRSRSEGWRGWFRYLYSLKIIIQQSSPRYIFYVTLELSMFGALLHNFVGGKKSFFLITGLGHHLISNNFKMVLRRIIQRILNQMLYIKKDHLFIFQNQDDRKLFIQKNMSYRKKTQIIRGNGVNSDIFKFVNRKKDDPLIILFAARLVTSKGIREFISASKVLAKKYPEVIFKVAGQYNPKDTESISKKFFDELCETIDYVGDIEYSKMPTTLAEASVFILPSYGEGLPKVALEAGSTGLPLILTNVAGCRDCIDNHKNGFLVETKDVDDLVKKIEILIMDIDLRLSQGINSRNYISKYFSNEVIHSSYIDLIK